MKKLLLLTLFLMTLLILGTGGCSNKGRDQAQMSPAPAQQPGSSPGYIRSLKISYSTSNTLIKFDNDRMKTPFPENTKGVILRISTEKVPPDTSVNVSWYFVKKHDKPLAVQSVSPDELNSHEYVDLSFYHKDGEFPAGDYEAIITDKATGRHEKIGFSVL